MIVHIIMSWLLEFQRSELWPADCARYLGRTEPPAGADLCTPVRRMLPDTRPLDLAPLAVFIGIIILRDILLPTLFGFLLGAT